jgi:glutamate--cysteine ligase
MATIAYDPEAAERAAFAVRGTAGLWADAARYGLEQPDLARAARACFRAAVDAFPGWVSVAGSLTSPAPTSSAMSSGLAARPTTASTPGPPPEPPSSPTTRWSLR